MYIYMSIFAVLAVVADQLSKWWAVEALSAGGTEAGIPGVFNFLYAENTGAAWSSFEGQQWLFASIFVIFTACIVWEFSKKRMPFTAFDRWCIVAIFAGGLGNMIDRIRLGYVVDMIHLEFMDFPVFNVADCFITCGSIALIISLIFFNKKFWKDENK